MFQTCTITLIQLLQVCAIYVIVWLCQFNRWRYCCHRCPAGCALMTQPEMLQTGTRTWQQIGGKIANCNRNNCYSNSLIYRVGGTGILIFNKMTAHKIEHPSALTWVSHALCYCMHIWIFLMAHLIKFHTNWI